MPPDRRDSRKARSDGRDDLKQSSLKTSRVRSSLLSPTSSFIGRARELRDIQQAVPEARLLTLTGAGGTGKTRLALEAAHRLADRFAGGATFIALDSISDPMLVLQTVAATLGVIEKRSRARLESLIEFLRDRECLLVLDNCEHLVHACASLVFALLEACPALRVLATSREPLRITGEHVYSVPPLNLPASTGDASLTRVKHFEAVELFAARARAANAAFVLDERNVAIIASICRRLDGMPLAIELAAARTRTLSVEDIAARLDDRFRLLTTGSRTAPPRHQTLQATLDWSYDLLSESERDLFHRLAVFAGGFTLEAAEAVCSAGDLRREHVFNMLTYIVDKSLVTAEGEQGETRFRMLETVRQYALKRLDERGGHVEARDRHLDYFLQLAERAESELQGADQVAWFDRLERELGNLRAATEWAMTPGLQVKERTSAGLRLSAALLSFWDSRGYPYEGVECLNRLLAQAERLGLSDTSTTLRPAPTEEGASLACAKALHALGALYWGRGRHAEAHSHLERALALGRALGDQDIVAHALRMLGSVNIGQGHADTGIVLLEQSIVIWRALGEAGRYGLGWSLTALGGAALLRGDYDGARECLEEAERLFEQSGNTNYLAYVRRRLGQVALHRGDLERATALCKESLRLNLEVSSRRGIAASLATLASVARARGQSLIAARIYGAVSALLDELGERLTPVDEAELESNRAETRAELGAEAFDAVFVTGRAQYLDSIVAEALAFTKRGHIEPARTPRQRDKIKYGGLTAREREVAALIAQGKSNREIAEALVVGIKAVEAHVGRMLTKLGFSSRAQIAVWAVDKGLASPPQAMTE
jgi:predicted ATPase/DNA-binding CsgD family transcriptional regulator